MWCHLLLLLPVAGLALFWYLPWPLAAILYVAGVAPSALLGWVSWRSLKTPPVMGMEAMLGEVGVAATDLTPVGQVRYHDALWTARSAEPVRRGGRVRIEAVDGLRLRVAPERR